MTRVAVCPTAQLGSGVKLHVTPDKSPEIKPESGGGEFFFSTIAQSGDLTGVALLILSDILPFGFEGVATCIMIGDLLHFAAHIAWFFFIRTWSKEAGIDAMIINCNQFPITMHSISQV